MTGHHRRGLVVGKFAPLHRGHELVIQTALSQCEEVVVISYSNPELPGCPPERRAAWLSALFPAAIRLVVTENLLKERLAGAAITIPRNDAAAAEHRRFVGFLCSEVLRTTVDVVYTSEDYGEGFARELSAYFCKRDPNATSVTHVSVDAARSTYPISGGALRGDVHGLRRWLAPAVYRTFVGRVALVGGESTGKTTLARELAARCGTRWVPEYGRALWEEREGRLRPDDLLDIGHRQVAEEEAALPHASEWLFCDTTPLTTLFYSRDLFGHAAAELEQLAERPYQLTVLCASDFPFVQDGTRRDEAFRTRQQIWYRAELRRRAIDFVEVTGTLAQRVAAVRAALAVKGAVAE